MEPSIPFDPTEAFGALMSFFKLATIFAFVLAVMWLKHYRNNRKAEISILAEDEKAALHDLTRVATKLEERIVTLEKILDSEQPKWRDTSA
jgi:phage shock protein B